ncbi:SDR family NAD(P)-dependent oxidoreductase [Patulibacter minatonensis]|uniref:SDR family NAD(P)-dependent oxidoreductase n=1 Tax=Patulibacter minatonensis TaxID=298163 RepID=UPI00047D75C1|nr:SDR family NAD(P)-dependent oxidoreductase [Patulibacter minatonensis]
MTTITPQHAIGSGFGARSTAEEVLEGIDLSGRLAVVTGGYSGIGLETVRALVNAGAHVVVPARRVAHAVEQLADVGTVATLGATGGVAPGSAPIEVDELDLADLESVRAFAERFLASGRSIDLLINDAAVMANPETRVGPGWESQFATNHLGHYALTARLWPALVAGDGARVVALSSTGHKRSGIRWDDVMFEQGGYDKWDAYGQAKSANSLFAVHLDAAGREHGVRAFAAHPGGILTPLQRHLTQQEMDDRGWFDENGQPIDRFKTVEQGASTATWAATSPELDGLGGVYCEDCEIAEPTDVGGETEGVSGVDAHAIDRDQAARLWTLSAELTGVNPF